MSGVLPDRKRVTRVVSYRRHVDRYGFLKGATLESKLRAAFSPLHPKNIEANVGERSMSITKTHAINYFESRDGGAHDESYFYGELICFEKGAAQSYIEHRSNARYLTIAQMGAGTDRDWLNSIMYFLVKGDVVLGVQTSSVGFKQLQTYFQWLLTIRSEVIPTAYKIRLEEPMDVDAVGEDYSSIRAIRIRDPNEVGVRQGGFFKEVDVGLTLDKDLLSKYGWRVMGAIANAARNIDALADQDYERLSSRYSIRANVAFRIEPNKSCHRREDVAALVEFISQLPDELVEIETADGKIVEGKMRVSSIAEFISESNSQHLDWRDTPRVLEHIYKRWLDGGKIKV